MYPPLTLRTDPKPLKPKEANHYAVKMGMASGKWKGLVWQPDCFESQTQIVELVSEETLNAPRYYGVVCGDVFEPVSYGTGYIEALAMRQGLVITKGTVDDYIRLYLAFTRGQSGRVLPIEQVDQLPLREELSLITRRKIQSFIVPMTAYDDHGVSGCFLIADKLFQARASVDPKTGQVALDPTGLLADTLPVLDSVLEE